MKICIDCDEEVVEEKFDDHKKCTKTLISEYENKIKDMEKSHKLELRSKIFEFRKQKEEFQEKIASEESKYKNLKEELLVAKNDYNNLWTKSQSLQMKLSKEQEVNSILESDVRRYRQNINWLWSELDHESGSANGGYDNIRYNHGWQEFLLR